MDQIFCGPRGIADFTRVSSRENHFGGEAPGSGCGFIYFLYNCPKF